ncbi:Uncharacterized protein TPAR_08097 [Tolypocladium paradoxum]|uniref:Uncharacterized protein n=1 Tax=Tolypocladium paradoxum TaxID=94208 RepID=A0A2S4KNB4_9HYPO|nr:Uncharacterized protein TPAR_08097 [Tolypocladium paradoxum]
MSQSITPDIGEDPGVPKRILVQTKTHLVPGDDYHQRCLFLLDVMCRHHWNRDFDPRQDRWSEYGAWFGYDNRRCYFLVDHGQSSADRHVPVLWYEWTGESLKAMPRFLPLELQTRLQEYPFNRPSRKDLPKRPPLDACTRRQSIRSKLRSEMCLSDSDFEFMREHPEEARWLKEHIESRFWSKFEALANALNDQG